MVQKNNVPGFSLIEILIALAIGSFVMIMVFDTITSLQKSTQRYSELVTVDSQQERLYNQLQRDISGMVIPLFGFVPSPEKTPEEQKKEQQEYFAQYGLQCAIENDLIKNLTFVTTSILSVFGTTKPHLVRVQYTLEPDKVNAQYYTLMREEASLEKDTKTASAGKEKYAIAFGIKTCGIQCITVSEQDGKRKIEEVASWSFDKNSKEKQEKQIALPRIIILKGTMVDIASVVKREHEFEYAFFIPINAIIDSKTESTAQKTPETQAPTQTPAATAAQGQKPTASNVPAAPGGSIFDKMVKK